MDEYNDEREKERKREEKICNEYLTINLLVKVFNIRIQNIILLNDVFIRTTFDEFGKLKKAFLYNSSEIQLEELNHCYLKTGTRKCFYN
jgi:hypothetical protein